jgi:hypothetical protein
MASTGKLWIRVDSDVPRDPRISAFAAALRVPHALALGMVLKVWCAMSEHAADGDLSSISDAIIDEWAGAGIVRGLKTGVFAACFAEYFLDETRQETRFAEVQEPAIEYRRKARERMAAKRARERQTFSNSSRTADEPFANGSCQRNETERNDTEPNRERNSPLRGMSVRRSASVNASGAESHKSYGEAMRVFGELYKKRESINTPSGTRPQISREHLETLDARTRETDDALGGLHAIAEVEGEGLRILRSQFAKIYLSFE